MLHQLQVGAQVHRLRMLSTIREIQLRTQHLLRLLADHELHRFFSPLFVTICNGWLPVGATLPAFLKLIYIERVVLCVLVLTHRCKPLLDRPNQM